MDIYLDYSIKSYKHKLKHERRVRKLNKQSKERFYKNVKRLRERENAKAKKQNLERNNKNMKKKIKVLYKRVGREPEVIEIENTLQAMQSLVGGFIEVIPYDYYELVCNDEGKLQGLYPNVGFDYDIINGNFFIANDNYETGDLASLTDKNIEKIKEDLKSRSFHYTKTQMRAVLKQEKDLMKYYSDEETKKREQEIDEMIQDLEKENEHEPTEEDFNEMEKSANLNSMPKDLQKNIESMLYCNITDGLHSDEEKKNLEVAKSKVDKIKDSFGKNYGEPTEKKVKENFGENYGDYTEEKVKENVEKYNLTISDKNNDLEIGGDL